MFHSLRQFLTRKKGNSTAGVPEGERVYAIGDIHGRCDLFEVMIEAIESDDRARGPARTTVILLGDLVDRGPDSRGVIAAARQWQQFRDIRILCGNHEEMFLRGFDDVEILRHFLRHGGRETLMSYGIEQPKLSAATLEEVQEMMGAAVPSEDRSFMEAFEDMIVIGDYLFVHAGIQPGVALEEQQRQELRWIREPFLSYNRAHGPVVVHGHTIYDAPEQRFNRIGIDTGAYSSGVLTALVLEGNSRSFIETVEDEDGTISTKSEIAAD